MKLATRIAAVLVGATMAVVPLAPASAAAAEVETGNTHGVVDGVLYGPEDGYSETIETFDIEPGEDPLEVLYRDDPSGIGPLADWGASYARSTETAQLVYTGRAKAAANVYQGQRIVTVCVWYTQAGRSSAKACSRATSSGSRWTAGSEQVVRFVDNLSVNWPKTKFNIQTTRINPNIY